MGAAAGGARALQQQQMMAAVMRQMQGRTNQQQSLFQKPTSSQTSLVGDRDLPTENRSITPIPGIKGGYDVAYGGNSVGQLLRGGSNGRFVGNGNNIPSALPAQGGNVPQPGMPMQLGGGGGGTQLGGTGGMGPQRQYAPNPFQQQQMQAQMLRRPIAMNAPPQTGGFQSG